MVYSIIGNCDPADGEQPWKWGAEVANSWRTNIDAQVEPIFFEKNIAPKFFNLELSRKIGDFRDFPSEKHNQKNR